MAALSGIRIESRGSEDDELAYSTGEYESFTRARKNRGRGSRNRGNSRNSDGSSQSSRSGWDSGRKPESRSQEWGAQLADGQERATPLAQEGHRAGFYDTYRREAEEYDREFIKKHDEDLSTTLIFAGLFSAVTSAFIIQVQPQLQPDPNEETAALLRVLIHKIDNTTFGDDVPTVPQWSGPPSTIIHVQAMLYASLAASLFSAFLAMLGKQWLNRYASIDMRGSAIERSQNRQRKLDGIVAWYFDHVMESLPLMLQFALLLLNCALSRYLWGIDATVASVVIGVTSFGVIFYAFIIVAGAVSVSCPYQTPSARILRYTFRHLFPTTLGILRSASSSVIDGSEFVGILTICWRKLKRHGGLRINSACLETFVLMLPIYILFLPYALIFPTLLVYDACRLALAIARTLVDFPRELCIWFRATHRSDPRMAILDQQCISWMLRTSLDKTVHLSALKLFGTMTTPVESNPALISACFDTLTSCVAIVGGKVVITQGSEELAEASAMCCLRTLSHLAAVDPMLITLKGARKRYTRTFPSKTHFEGLLPDHSLGVIHDILHSSPPNIQWKGYKLLGNDQVTLAHTLTRLAHKHVSDATQNTWGALFRPRRRVKVPRWILRFALHHLSQDPLPPTSIVIDCLSVIAIDLGCDFLNTATTDEGITDEGARLEEISNLVVQKLATMVGSRNPSKIQSSRKAVTAFFPYAVARERDGERMMIDAFLSAAGTAGSAMQLWDVIRPFLPALFNQASHRTIVLTSPHVPWHSELRDGNLVARWAAATSAIPYTEDIGRNVVDALLHIASIHSLRPQIPVGIWTCLTKLPSLPPVCFGRSMGTKRNVAHRVRELGDIEILKSYFLLVWSEWDYFSEGSSWIEMQIMIREDFGGIGLGHHRKDLVERLDHVLRQLDQGLGFLKLNKLWIDENDVQLAERQYRALKKVLLEVDREALGILSRTPLRLTNVFDVLTPVACPRIPLDVRLCVPSPVSVVARLQRSLRPPNL